MAREKPRTAEEIDAELDEWLTHQNNLRADLSGLQESLGNLRTLIPEAGHSVRRDELTTLQSELETQLSAVKAELAEARETIAALKAATPSPPPSPPPAPSPGKPSPPPSDEPPHPAPPQARKTRTGHTFL